MEKGLEARMGADIVAELEDGLHLARTGYQPGSLQGIFLTHLHSDHLDGLGEMSTLRWASGGDGNCARR